MFRKLLKYDIKSIANIWLIMSATVLAMSVFAGFGGQKFIEDTYARVEALKAEIEAQGLDIPIEVDGGVSAANAAALVKAGAEILVAGSAVFKAEDPAAMIAQMRA